MESAANFEISIWRKQMSTSGIRHNRIINLPLLEKGREQQLRATANPEKENGRNWKLSWAVNLTHVPTYISVH
jgi:hypothetical protein